MHVFWSNFCDVFWSIFSNTWSTENIEALLLISYLFQLGFPISKNNLGLEIVGRLNVIFSLDWIQPVSGHSGSVHIDNDTCRSKTAKPTYIKKEKDIPRLPEI